MSVDRDQRKRPSSHAALEALFQSGSLTGLTDAQLVDAFLDRSEPQLAFAMIVERHGGMVLRTCQAILRNEADAEDALQVTFLVLARKAPSLRNRTSLAAWLHAVATRTAKSAQRGMSRRRLIEARVVAKSPADEHAPDDLREQLQLEVAKLPERLREVVVLREFEGLSEQQAAGQLGCAEGTVKSRLYRARRRLRSRLEARGWDASGLLAPLTAPTASLFLPTTVIESITHVSVSSGASIPARLVAWRSIVLRGMLMKNVLYLTAVALVVSIPLGSRWLIARADGPDNKQQKASLSPTSAQAAEEERIATLYATLAKSQVALAEALIEEVRLLEDEEREGKRREQPVYRHPKEPEDRLLSSQFDLAQTSRERISILRRRLVIARVFEENHYGVMELEPGSENRVKARIATLHRIAIATQLAKEQMRTPIDNELLMKAQVKDVDALRQLLFEFEGSESKKTTEEIMAMTFQLSKQEKWRTLNEFLIAWRAATIQIDAPGIAIEVEGAALSDAKLELTSPVICPDGPMTFADYLKSVLDPLGLEYRLQFRGIYIDGKGPKKKRKDGVPPHNYSIFPFPD